MGKFLEDDNPDSAPVAEERYLKFDEPAQGKTVEVKIRILENKPERVFRHWIGPDIKHSRPYNCPSKSGGCPACAERFELKNYAMTQEGDVQAKLLADVRELHRMDKKFLVNVLVVGEEPKVRIYSFGQKVADKLDVLQERMKNSDLRDWDLTVIKRKTGPEKFNIDYDVITEEQRPLTDAEKSVAEGRFDLKEEVKPADVEVIATAVAGLKIKAQVAGDLATKEQADRLVKAAKAKGYKLSDIDMNDPLSQSAAAVEKMIEALNGVAAE